MTLRKLSHNERGAGAVEFALVAPVLITFIIGIAQLGTLFFANAGLRSAVGEGARLATIYPRPTDTAIIARITDRKFGLEPQYITNPTVAHTTVGGREYIDIQMSYQAPIDFIFFRSPAITLTENRRVYLQPPPDTTGSGTTGSGTSTGGTTTSTGGATTTPTCKNKKKCA